jgi:hypothetical protein
MNGQNTYAIQIPPYNVDAEQVSFWAKAGWTDNSAKLKFISESSFRRGGGGQRQTSRPPDDTGIDSSRYKKQSKVQIPKSRGIW